MSMPITRSVCALLATLACSMPVMADPPPPDTYLYSADEERAALARLMQELRLLEPLIDEAERVADRDARVQLQYSWLRSDLRKIYNGILDHLEAPRSGPRDVPPLRGDYRR